MTEQQHPITPPPELVEQWYDSIPCAPISWKQELATQAARWGWQQRDASVPEELQKARDAELEACCEWLNQKVDSPWALDAELRAARRPKPPRLAEEAFDAAKEMSDCMSHGFVPKRSSLDIIRAALERLQELEQQENND